MSESASGLREVAHDAVRLIRFNYLCKYVISHFDQISALLYNALFIHKNAKSTPNKRPSDKALQALEF